MFWHFSICSSFKAIWIKKYTNIVLGWILLIDFHHNQWNAKMLKTLKQNFYQSLSITVSSSFWINGWQIWRHYLKKKLFLRNWMTSKSDLGSVFASCPPWWPCILQVVSLRPVTCRGCLAAARGWSPACTGARRSAAGTAGRLSGTGHHRWPDSAEERPWSGREQKARARV